MTTELVILISGSGSNLAAVIAAIEAGELDARIACVVSNNPDAYGLQRAADAGLRHEVLLPDPAEDRSNFDARLAALVEPFSPDLVVLAGWIRLLTPTFLNRFSVINLHPAQPGAFPGLHAIERAFQAAQHGEINESGVMVHFVPDAGVDDGPVICWEAVPILGDDQLDDFEARIHQTEHRLLVQAISDLSSKKQDSMHDVGVHQ